MTNLWLMLLIKSTIVLTAGCLLARAVRKCPAATRHLIWLSTLLALLILPLGLALPGRAFAERWAVDVSASGNPATAMVAHASGDVAFWLTAIWATGFTLLAARLVLAWWRAARLINLGEEHGTATGVRIRIADNVTSPLAWSFGHGLIVFPRGVESWTKAQQEAAMKHEMAHICRRDCQALLAGEIACAVYWFHPLVWYSARQMRLEQEYAADDCVLRQGWNPAEYATELLNIAKSGRNEQLLAGAGTTSMLTARVNAILQRERSRTMTTRRMMLTSVAAVLAIALPLAAMQAGRRVYRIGDGVTAPKQLYKEEPAYTQEARDAKVEGAVLLSGVIEADGSITEVRVERSLDAGLDNNAVEAVKRWQFKPAEKDGVPVAVSVRIEVNFRLL